MTSLRQVTLAPICDHRKFQIAFDLMSISDTGWLGGDIYLENLFLALKSLNVEQKPEIVLLGSKSVSLDGHMLVPFVDEILESPSDPLWFRLWMHFNRLFRLDLPKWMMPRTPLSIFLRKRQVDCIFAQGEYGTNFDIPLLSWIVDFQHIHLTSMFSPGEIQNRNDFFTKLSERADRIILSSQNALHDFQEFAPHAAHKARVLSFVVPIPEELYELSPLSICEQYHLPSRFIYLPNQFWVHKNHDLVIQALSLVKDQNPDLDISIVCTGSTFENRDPLYFSRLLSAISERNLRNNFLILGMVPHQYVFHLMRQSLAVLQPSLFEGWSTTVEEAKSLGKSILLSDIPVHREQNPPSAVYFDPRDPKALADCFVKTFKGKEPGPDYELEAAARQRLPERIQHFGRTFVEIAREIVPAK